MQFRLAKYGVLKRTNYILWPNCFQVKKTLLIFWGLTKLWYRVPGIHWRFRSNVGRKRSKFEGYFKQHRF